MSFYDDQLNKLQHNLEVNRKVAETGDALERLTANRDFKKVIIEGFFEKEAIRLVQLKGHPEHQSEESQKRILMQMDAIGVLASYFDQVATAAELARKAISFDEETYDQLATESLNVA